MCFRKYFTNYAVLFPQVTSEEKFITGFPLLAFSQVNKYQKSKIHMDYQCLQVT